MSLARTQSQPHGNSTRRIATAVKTHAPPDTMPRSRNDALEQFSQNTAVVGPLDAAVAGGSGGDGLDIDGGVNSAGSGRMSSAGDSAEGDIVAVAAPAPPADAERARDGGKPNGSSIAALLPQRTTECSMPRPYVR